MLAWTIFFNCFFYSPWWVSDINNCTSHGVWNGTSIPIICLCRCSLCCLSMSDCSSSFGVIVDDTNIYIFMYDNVLIENTYEVCFHTYDTQVTPCFCASWYAPLGYSHSHFRCQSHGGYITMTVPGGVTWLKGRHMT